MRYGKPSIESRVHALQQQGCQNILAMALYPQYAASTTATAYDALFNSLKNYVGNQPFAVLPLITITPPILRLWPKLLNRVLANIPKGQIALWPHFMDYPKNILPKAIRTTAIVPKQPGFYARA